MSSTTVKKSACIGFDKRPRRNSCNFCFTNELYRDIEITVFINILIEDAGVLHCVYLEL